MDFNFSRKLVLITVKLHQASNLATGLAAAGVAAVLETATPGRSAQWPARPVTVIVPLAAGGNTGMMAWLGAQSLTEKLGQTFIVENRPSAGGAIGTTAVATAAPDGYTILFAPSSMLLLTPMLQKLNVPEMISDPCPAPASAPYAAPFADHAGLLRCSICQAYR
jgi:tripartite-type tricarboxylate transporter receptor subunit TctC